MPDLPVCFTRLSKGHGISEANKRGRIRTVLQTGKAKWLWLAVITVVFAAAAAISAAFGSIAFKACLWAIAAAAAAAGGSLVPVIYSAVFRPSMLAGSAMAAGVIRLLLMLAGAVTILFFITVDILWFISWLMLFYPVMIVAEVCFILRAVNEDKQGDGF